MALSASETLQGQGGLKNPLLHGSDIPKQFEGVLIRVKAIRKSPANFKAPFIVDFEEPYPYGCKSWAMNSTNVAIAAEKIGDNLEKLVGKKMYLKCITTNNPATEETVRSLNIGRIEGERVARIDTVAKKKSDGKKAKTCEGISEKDLPF